MIRWTEWRGSHEDGPSLLIKKLLNGPGCVVQIHKFIRPDEAGCFHSHPAFALRIILRGGYIEELADGRKRTWRPGQFGIVRPDLSHRIDSLLNDRSSWSLWIRGPKVARISVKGCS